MNAENSVSGRENRKCRGPGTHECGCLWPAREKSGEAAKLSQKGYMRSMDSINKNKTKKKK